ncbi:MAG: DUF1015 domain-containing protein [Planctomycetes bacterium]|nr:DUF1015 domain-containing protein [Planctomycetota bacterium]MCW8135548.1 DUF1015 domain-containing protein [Planctomycetota bacterium]
MRIRAFTPLRPPADKAHLVASLPYDVVTTDEARELARDNPLSMLHVVRAEIDFPEGTDPHSDAVYAKAVENFKRLQSTGALVRESGPSLYVYQQQMGAHIQRGVVALCHVDDYDAGLIKKHEKTRRDKEDDRTRLTSDLSANAGPVFLTYRDHKPVSELVAAIVQTKPDFDFTAPDGIRHTGWRVPGGGDLVAAFKAVPAFYVADGHHRSASAARVARMRRDANPGHTGNEDYNWFLCVMFPAGELNILPYNRLVHDLNGHSPQALIKATGAKPGAQPSPGATGKVSMYVAGAWHTLTLEPAPDADPVSRLDVQMLQEQVLAPLLGIDDPRTSERISFAGGIRGTDYLRKQVDAGKAAVAFSMYPVSVNQLMDIADAGQIMPPKSTWFEPKLRSGLFVHTL